MIPVTGRPRAAPVAQHMALLGLAGSCVLVQRGDRRDAANPADQGRRALLTQGQITSLEDP